MTPVEETLIWLASIACAIGIGCQLAAVLRGRQIDLPPLFVVFYFTGITAWFGFGVALGNWALIVPCGLQIPAMLYLIWRMTRERLQEEQPHGA